jgi:anthranilate phosphoribosyltransferase
LSQIVGLSHPPHFEKTAEVLRMLGCSRALVVSGVEGDPELSIAALTRVLELRDERISPLTFASKDVGLPLGTQRDMAGFPSDQRDKEAELLKRILHHQVPGGPCDWVVMNAALILYAAGKGATWVSCVPLARRALVEGAAARKLEELTQEPVGIGTTGRLH